MSAEERFTRLDQDRRMLSTGEVDEALEFVAATGIVELVTSEIDDRRRSPAGAKAKASLSALLAGMWIDVRLHGSFSFTRVAHILYRRIDPALRPRLGMKAEGDDPSDEAAYARVLRLWHGMEKVLNDSPRPPNRRLPEAEAQQLADERALEPAEAHKRRELRLQVMNLLLKPTLEGYVGLFGHQEMGGCVDATAVGTWARPPSRRDKVTSADPDAAFYTRTTEGPDGKKKTTKTIFGYEASLHTAGPTGPARPGEIAPPVLVTGMTVAKPAVTPGRLGAEAIRWSVFNGVRPRWIAGDRAYNSSRPEDFQLPARAYTDGLLFDYRKDQLGVQGEWEGAKLVDGTFYCPHMPEPLVTATKDRVESLIDDDTLADRVEARRLFALHPKAHPDDTGAQRFHCPAAGPVPRLACPRQRRSMGEPGRLTVDPRPEPAGPPRVCNQQSITIPAEAGAKHRQAFPYLTQEWSDRYYRQRNSIEGFNGYIKDPAAANLEDPRGRQVRGLAAQSILLAFQVAATNARKITRWRAKHPT